MKNPSIARAALLNACSAVQRTKPCRLVRDPPWVGWRYGNDQSLDR